MEIVYDDIIYSLQKAGGVSLMWAQITDSPPYPSKHILYSNAANNIFFSKKDEDEYDIRSNSLLSAKRYCNINISRNDTFIFHSSYFRYCKNKNAINITNVYDFIYEKYFHKPKDLLHKIQKRNAVMHSDGVICISESTKRDFYNYYPKYAGKVQIIYPGYDHETFFFKQKTKDKIVVYVGGRLLYKRFDYTVEIVSHLPDCSLIIIGGGALTNKEINLLESKIHGRYRTVGYLSNKDLRELYNTAFFLSYCSDYEGFGIPPVEAQACGCPVVCQSKSSLPEVVKETAIYFDPNKLDESINNIKQLYNKTFYLDIVEKGLENAKRFSWDNCRKGVYDFYQVLLAR